MKQANYQIEADIHIQRGPERGTTKEKSHAQSRNIIKIDQE